LLPNLFLLSTSRHPPLSHLFPYTTLFRSALWRRLSTAPRAPKARRSQHSNIALSATRRQSMPLRKQTAQAAERARHFATGSARQLQARAKYLAHLAAAQGYRAAASAAEAPTRATA